MVASLANLGNSCDVVPMPVRFQHMAHIQRAAQLQQLFVLVGCVYEHRLAGATAANDEDIVVHRPHHHLVHLNAGVSVVERGACIGGSALRIVLRPAVVVYAILIGYRFGRGCIRWGVFWHSVLLCRLS